MTTKKTTLKRKLQKMPLAIKEVLVEARLWDAYRARPPYQKNDYLRWIAQAVKPETKMKRLRQMIAELKKGDVYMRMKWNGKQ